MVVGPFRGGSLCGGYTMWWLGLSVVGHCVVGHCVVGAQCGGYAMVVNVLNPARFNSGHLKLSDCFICFYMYITPLTEIRFHFSLT